MLKCIAIIPARGGSKRIPKKNIKEFHGKPLIAYSIEVALKSKLFEKIIVSTDDELIAKVALKCGAEIPFIRPKELSDDFTGTGAVVEHAIKYLKEQGEEYDFCCTIYATAPLLQEKYLMEGFEKLKNSDAHQVFCATIMPSAIQRSFKINENGRCEMFWRDNFYKRSQDLEEAYYDAGQFYWENLKNNFTDIPYGRDSIPLVIPSIFVQDIDTFEDWDKAEILYELIKKLKKDFNAF